MCEELKTPCIYEDEKGIEYLKVAETDDYIFVAPFKRLDDGGKEIDYTRIKVYSKHVTGYPIEKVVSYLF